MGFFKLVSLLRGPSAKSTSILFLSKEFVQRAWIKTDQTAFWTNLPNIYLAQTHKGWSCLEIIVLAVEANITANNEHSSLLPAY